MTAALNGTKLHYQVTKNSKVLDVYYIHAPILYTVTFPGYAGVKATQGSVIPDVVTAGVRATMVADINAAGASGVTTQDSFLDIAQQYVLASSVGDQVGGTQLVGQGGVLGAVEGLGQSGFNTGADVVGGITSLADFLEYITSEAFAIRAGEFIVGAILLAVAAKAVFGGTSSVSKHVPFL